MALYRFTREGMRAASLISSQIDKRSRNAWAGRALFAAVLLLIAGTLNILYGIGALDDANIFVNEKRYILDEFEHARGGC